MMRLFVRTPSITALLVGSSTVTTTLAAELLVVNAFPLLSRIGQLIHRGAIRIELRGSQSRPFGRIVVGIIFDGLAQEHDRNRGAFAVPVITESLSSIGLVASRDEHVDIAFRRVGAVNGDCLSISSGVGVR